MIGHHLQLPLGLNAQSIGILLLRVRVDIDELMLLVNENTVPVFLSPHADAEGVIFVLLIQFLRPFLCNIMNVIKHNERVTSGLNNLPGHLQYVLLV
jgi:hypothetical protein